MKTFKTILLTIGFVVILTGLLILNYGFFTVTERGTNHTKVVMIDDVEVERTNYRTVHGYDLNLDINKSIRIGK